MYSSPLLYYKESQNYNGRINGPKKGNESECIPNWAIFKIAHNLYLGIN